jgi:hypothetical protein
VRATQKPCKAFHVITILIGYGHHDTLLDFSLFDLKFRLVPHSIEIVQALALYGQNV